LGITPFFTPDYDLLLLAKELVTAIPITIIGAWVKGHYVGKIAKYNTDSMTKQTNSQECI